MKFFKNTWVAILLTALVIVLCCVLGYIRAYDPVAPTASTDIDTDRPSGQSNLNYYLDWINDGADLFTLNTMDNIARRSLTLDSTYGSFMAIKTVSYLNGADIRDVAEQAANTSGIGRRDLFLLLDADTQDWYVTYGSQMAPYAEANDQLPALFRKHLNNSFWQDDASNEVILELFEDLEDWYADNLPVVEAGQSSPFQHAGSKDPHGISLRSVFNTVLLTVLANLWWIVLLLLGLNLADQFRFDRYYTRSHGGTDDSESFRPLLFWHHEDSRWYDRMMIRMEEDNEDEEET